MDSSESPGVMCMSELALASREKVETDRKQVPYNPQSSSSNSALDPKSSARLEKIESVLSILVRHVPGIGGYEQIQQWASSEFHLTTSAATTVCDFLVQLLLPTIVFRRGLPELPSSSSIRVHLLRPTFVSLRRHLGAILTS